MKDIKELHNEAMDLALQGDVAAGQGLHEESIQLYHTAFEKEREAALLADFMQNPEPGLSILFRSAASLAVQCGLYREAEQLVAKALSGNPTPEIARELREILQDIYTHAELSDDTAVYQLEIPDKERTRFESILQQFGLSPANMRRVIGRVAL